MKKVVRYISEIIMAVVLIFISYFVWDRIDVEAYEKFITQYTLDDIAVTIDDSFSILSYVSDENNAEGSLLSVNNYQNKEYNANVMLELNGINQEVIDNLILTVDNKRYNLNDIFCYKKSDKQYFLITNVNLDEYEKQSFNLKLLVNDSYEFSNVSNFSYNIVEEIV